MATYGRGPTRNAKGAKGKGKKDNKTKGALFKRRKF